jgi:peptidoglycan hydrolase-like protein with peptidoglycan-binding domain
MAVAGVILKAPDFKLPAANPSDLYPDPLWWLWLRTKAYVGADLALGGIYANKSGFHNTGNANKSRWPNNYSIRDKVNQSGPGMTKSCGLDLTFRSAQSGNYTNIDLISSRLMSSMLNPNDPRLDMYLFEFYGQIDNDRVVEGYNEYKEDDVSSDDSHLWHIHESALRSKVGDWWGAWATYTVHCGLSVVQWKATLPNSAPPAPKPKPVPVPAGIPTHAPGSRTIREGAKGTDVLFVQKFIGEKRCGKPDGEFGPKTTAGVKWYQGMRFGWTKPDGVLEKGGQTWRAMGH